MLPLANMPMEIASAISVVFTDIDDTLTEEGRLSALAYQAVEALAEVGIAVAPITGRPAGWCDMIARFWPVAGVVGENGAFYFSYDSERRRMRRFFSSSAAEREANRHRLEILGKKILAAVPGAALSADQAYRETDLAIDYCEDVPELSTFEINRIKDLFESAGAEAKISSIHVNGWYGKYDKLSMTRHFAADILGIDLDQEKKKVVFVGDSPNDAPMFAYFPHACGVANIKNFASTIEAKPSYVTRAECGGGFVELAQYLLVARGWEGKICK